MKSEKLSTEIAALERKIKSAKNAVVKKVLEKKIETLRSELKKEEDGLSKLAKAKKKIREMSQKDFNEFIKMLSKKDGFAFLKSMTKDEIKRDIKREAKPVGWRFRGDNTKKPTRRDIREKNDVYYEGRRNRSDVSRAIKLAEGGGVDRFKDFELNKEGNFESIIDGKKYEIIYRDDVSQMYDLFEDGKIINSNKSVRDVMKFKNGGKMEWGGTAESSETGDFIGGENQSSMYAKGGSLFDEPHRTEMSGMMANGGGIFSFFSKNKLRLGDILIINKNNLPPMRDGSQYFTVTANTKLRIDKINNDTYSIRRLGIDDGSVNQLNEYPKKDIDNFIKNGQLLKEMADGGMMANGGGVDGNFYILLNDDSKKWYSQEDVTKIPNIYFASGFQDPNDEGVAFVHYDNALRPVYKANGQRADKMFQYAGMSGSEIKAKGGGVGSNGGMMAKGGMTFSESVLKEGLSDMLNHLYKAQNELDGIMGYLDRTGQGGMKSALKSKFGLDKLSEMTEKINNYLG